MVFNENYPDEVPQVLCMDRVYHPNIDVEFFQDNDDGTAEGSNICVSLLDEWDSDMDLDHIVMAILFLMYNPNPGDALSVYFDSESHVNMEDNIRLTLGGGTLDGTQWPCLLVEGEDDGDVKNDSTDETVPATPTPESDEVTSNNMNEPPVAAEEVTTTVTDDVNSSDMVGEIASGPEGNSIKSTPSTPSINSNCDDSPTTQCNMERMLKRQISALDDLASLDPKDCPVIEDQAELFSFAVTSRSFQDGTGSGKAFVDRCSPCLKALFCNFGKKENDIHVQAFFTAPTVDSEYSEVD